MMFSKIRPSFLLPCLSILSGAFAQQTNTTNASFATFSGNVASTILVIATDSTSATVAAQGLNGYGIPHQNLIVPQTGAALPTLSSSAGGNFGGIIVASGVAYEYSASNFSSALTNDQWNALYEYQIAYGVRMVQYGIFPTLDAGVVASGGCCNTSVLQPISLTNTSAFAQAGLKENAALDTSGLYHYPSTISNTTTTTAIAEFGSASDGSFTSNSVAAVINNFESGRQQMVFFIDFSPNWSATSSILQHAYITWLTRGLYAGYRRVNLNTQIDDMFLETDLYLPSGTTYRVTPDDLTGIVNWLPSVRALMPAGSNWTVEIGFNGNGNIEQAEATDQGYQVCSPDSIEYGDQPDTALEFKKPLGSGTDIWPATPTTYNYSVDCLNLDPLKTWFDTNVHYFNTISHTFTHEDEDNATYADVLKEIEFNQAWLTATGIGSGNFTANGLIPPAITGLHNGDALRAWHDAGLVQCVGDNSRPVLRNQENDMWPYITQEAADGYAGIQVNGRWPTRIYFNCDTSNCTTQEWINTSAGSGTFDDLLAAEKADSIRYLGGLYHDAFMFHQANLRTTGDLGTTTINGVAYTIGIFQAWVETVVQEYVRLLEWPIISMQQVDFSANFANRMTRDACSYGLTYDITSGSITGVTVTASGNTCGTSIPVTVPGSVTDTQGFTTEQIGSDPLTIWVQLSGSPVSFTLSQPVAL
ncbi:hypothetical protein N8I77_013487 [Diaporthe amygdali]|uniref:Extracellular serine-rich protein n=1 Tax=Phomopsis amygdali TaxID=1214568 RepID=A0AAD9VWE2_PHOAM|nr:hypothetical protein N8I77_013487 [Diaporthe amygdali]